MFTLTFLGKTTPCGEIIKTIATPINEICSNFVKFGRPEIYKVFRCLPNKKLRLALPLSLLRGSRSKSASISSGQRTQSAPYFSQIGSLSAEL